MYNTIYIVSVIRVCLKIGVLHHLFVHFFERHIASNRAARKTPGRLLGKSWESQFYVHFPAMSDDHKGKTHVLFQSIQPLLEDKNLVQMTVFVHMFLVKILHSEANPHLFSVGKKPL